MPVALLITVVAAVALVGAAAALAFRSLRGWWRLLAVPFGAAVALLGAVPAVLAVSLTHPARIDGDRDRPTDHGLPAVDVELTTEDAVRLAAWYTPSSNGAAVVLLHGSGGNRSRVLDHAAALADRGYGVLMPDARGHADSGGEPNLLGWHGDADVMAAVDYLTTRPDVRDARIGVVGMSMGGEQAIGAARVDPRIRAVVAEGATGRVRADDSWREPDTVERVVTWLTEGLTDLLSSAEPPTTLADAITRTEAPVLLIAGAEVEAEVATAAHLHDISPSTVSVWVATGAGHTEAFATDPTTWTTRVDRFLMEALS
jgi:dienelactone hydrolase